MIPKLCSHNFSLAAFHNEKSYSPDIPSFECDISKNRPITWIILSVFFVDKILNILWYVLIGENRFQIIQLKKGFKRYRAFTANSKLCLYTVFPNLISTNFVSDNQLRNYPILSQKRCKLSDVIFANKASDNKCPIFENMLVLSTYCTPTLNHPKQNYLECCSNCKHFSLLFSVIKIRIFQFFRS